VLIQKGNLSHVELQPGWVCLPFVLSLTLKEGGSGRSFRLLLFTDSARPDALLSLRRRLMLER
jgi:hypothetical protein